MNRKASHLVTHWNATRPEQARRMALLGATNQQIADMMMVDVKTIEYWVRTKPEFAASMRMGKMEADAHVAEALYKAAIGYDYEEDVVSTYKGVQSVVRVTKHMPGNPWAMWKWLTARQRGLWTDVQHVENTQTNINITKFDFKGLSTEELRVMEKLGLKQLAENVSFEENQN